MADKVSKKRRLISGANAVWVITVTIAIAIVLNLISTQVFARWDLTESNRYTLSEASIGAVQDLEEPVEVKAFISQDLPKPFHNLRQQVRDTLEEYRARSNGNLDFQIISPQDDEDVEETAKGHGCEKVTIGEKSEDRVSLRKVFKCIAILQGEDRQVIGDLQVSGPSGFANLEYELTKALLNLGSTEPRKVGFVAGFGGMADQRQFGSQLNQVFEKVYGGLISSTTVDLSGDNPSVPEDVDALIFLNPENQISDSAIFALDKFIQRGGSVGWYQSSTALDRQMMQQMAQKMRGQRPPRMRKPVNTGLTPVFTAYGIKHGEDILLDYENGMTARAFTQSGLQQVTLPSTFQMTDVDRNLPFTQHLSSLALPVPSSLEIQPWVNERDDVEVFDAVQTFPTATRVTDPPRQFNYQAFQDEIAGEEGKYTVVAALQGNIPSYYEDNPLPEGKSQDALETKSNVPSRILVVGSGDFLQPNPQLGYDGQLRQIAQNFFLSSIEWLAQDTALTDIRSKSMPAMLGKVDAETQRDVKLINIGAVPAVFVLLGFVMVWRRRARKSSIRDRMGDGDERSSGTSSGGEDSEDKTVISTEKRPEANGDVDGSDDSESDEAGTEADDESSAAADDSNVDESTDEQLAESDEEDDEGPADEVESSEASSEDGDDQSESDAPDASAQEDDDGVAKTTDESDDSEHIDDDPEDDSEQSTEESDDSDKTDEE